MRIVYLLLFLVITSCEQQSRIPSQFKKNDIVCVKGLETKVLIRTSSYVLHEWHYEVLFDTGATAFIYEDNLKPCN